MASLKSTAMATCVAALASFVGVCGAQSSQGDAASYPVLTPDLMSSLGNNSLFTRWRPKSHFLSPHSWMNDPCGPLYDPTTETYHLHYQFNPNHVNWGNISWGHAVSKDLFHWTDVRDWVNDSAVSLASMKYPSAPLSQFTGTTQPVNLEGVQDGTLLTFLTGIHYLPTNWKLPYEEGTEVQAMFTSDDGGLTWDELGTVLSGPPEGWNVTGWRDPSFFPSTYLDDLTGASEPRFYMVLGSGLKSGEVPAELPDPERPGFLGSRIPLYAAPAHNLTEWSFLGALWEPAANESLGDPDVTGSWGYNFEVTSLFGLDVPSTGEKAWFVGVGTEGGNTTSHWREQWALWNRGELSRRDNGSVEFAPTSGAALDWGIAYAQATWEDGGRDGRRVMWGWANEDIVEEAVFDTAKQLGYQGIMTLPAELYVKETEGVLSCRDDEMDGNVCVSSHGTGCAATAQTLGIRPLPDVLELMRKGSECLGFEVGELSGPTQRCVSEELGDSYELTATLENTSGKAGIVVGQSPDNEEYTVIYFDPETETIGIDRDHSSLLPHFNNRTFEGHFEPYIFADEQKGDSRSEALEFHVVLDGSLLEVWVNERFAITARIYPSRKDSTGLSFFAGNGAAAEWRDVRVWKGLADAWPERPEDSSVPLVWDSPEDSGNYTWWAGYR